MDAIQDVLKRIAELRGSQPNRTYTNPVSGDRMYQPPMPTIGRGRVQPMVMPTPINLTTGKPERMMLSDTSTVGRSTGRVLKSQVPTGRGTVPDDYDYGSKPTAQQKKSPYTGLPLYEKDITGVEAARRFKEYAEANNIKMDGNTPIFSSKAQADAAYAAGYRGTGKIKLSKADIEASRKRQEEEARRPIGNLSSDMLGPLFASGVMKPDTLKRKLINDDFFVDKTGIFGEKGKKYNIQLPKDQINLAHTKFTMTPPPPPPKMEGRYVPPTSNLGTPDLLIPSNIVGQSFDPSFAASFTPPPQPPGSTFGGYGQQAPMQALAPYAGMAQSNPQPTDFFPNYIPRPDPVFEQAPSPPRPVMGSGG